MIKSAVDLNVIYLLSSFFKNKSGSLFETFFYISFNLSLSFNMSHPFLHQINIIITERIDLVPECQANRLYSSLGDRYVDRSLCLFGQLAQVVKPKQPSPRPRRGQGRDGRGEGQGCRGRLVPAEVRGRRAPRSAGASDRIPGPHPHLGGRRARPTEAEQVEVQINDNDLKVDVFRSSGPGGQSVNTTDSAVRITHLPSGIVVSCQNEKSQLQNKEQAMRVLRARLLAQAEADADAKASAERRSQVRTVDRSERVRTYNFPENRISDHRVGYKAYNLDQVIDGDLDAVIDALAAADLAAKLVGAGDDEPAAR